MNKYLPYTVVPISIYTLFPILKSESGFLSLLNITFLWWSILIFVLYIFSSSSLRIYKGLSSDYKKLLLPLLVYISYIFLQVPYGISMAEIYWDYKGLVSNVLSLLLVVVSFVALDPKLIGLIFQVYFKRVLPLFLLFCFFIIPAGFGNYLIPITFFVFFLPVLSFKWKIIIISTTILVLVADLSSRSNVIKFFIPLVLSILFFFRNSISSSIINIVRLFFLLLPIILFVIGINGVFNIFKMDEYIDGSYVEVKRDADGNLSQEDLTADTRTFIYEEVLSTADKYNSWIFGRSLSRGNETVQFANWAYDITGREERLINEIGVINIFMWTGIVGVILYFIIFLRASFLAINRSNNIFIKLIGLYVAFRWTYSWVEDMQNFTLNYFMLWVFIGICFSSKFRSMENSEIVSWVRAVLK